VQEDDGRAVFGAGDDARELDAVRADALWGEPRGCASIDGHAANRQARCPAWLV
jgi:hypothetical protein